MTDNSKKTSQLPVADSVVGTDRVVILKDPSGSSSTRTITVANFANNIFQTKIGPSATPEQKLAAINLTVNELKQLLGLL